MYTCMEHDTTTLEWNLMELNWFIPNPFHSAKLSISHCVMFEREEEVKSPYRINSKLERRKML